MLPRVRAQVHGQESLTSYAVVKVVYSPEGTTRCPTDHLMGINVGNTVETPLDILDLHHQQLIQYIMLYN